ncbi:MAG: cyanophycinase [Acidimicrobiales bacterium]|nr:cyanophycinase [Acidimicrobiales bacterium]
MRNRIRHLLAPGLAPTLALAIGLSIQIPTAQVAAQQAPEYGPPNGTLLIAGGGVRDAAIYERFIELGGGAEDGRFIIVPTAGGNNGGDGDVRDYDEDQVLRGWRARGVQNVSMLHTHDPAVSDTEAFVTDLKQATAVWFNGGRQWNIVDSYAGTRTYDLFHAVLERGGVIGGSSAGATIQGEYLVRGATEGSQIVMTDEENHQLGFEFLRKSAIDQHINARMRWDDIIPVIEQQPHLLGIGLSEGTAIIVTGDTFEVMGKWKVAVHDNTRTYQPWQKPYFVLAPGDAYDMKARRTVKLGDGTTPRR